MPKRINYAKFFSTYLRQDIPEHYAGEFRMDCPFFECVNPTQHFYANCDTGGWHCKHCDNQGYARTLITLLHQQYLAETTEKQYRFLASIRKINTRIFSKAKLAYDVANDRWLVPYHTYDPEAGHFTDYLNNLGMFYPSSSTSPYTIQKGPGLPLYLYNPGIHTTPHTNGICDLLEGEWDTWAYIEMHEDSQNLILGKPGAGFSASYLKTLSKCHTLRSKLDNDLSGVKQTAGIVRVLQEQKSKLKIFIVDWLLVPPDDRKREHPTNPPTNPYAPKDIRDMMIERRDTMTEEIETATVPYDDSVITNPDEESTEQEEKLTAGYVRDVTVFPHVTSFGKYIQTTRSMLHLVDESIDSMAAVLAITASIGIAGEPLWGFLKGPASSGKTQFIESFGGNNQLFDNLSKVTAESFVSGWRDETGEEASYLPSLKNKTLFIKDFTTTLMGPIDAQQKVFGLLTDIYDGHVRIPYGNNQIKEFHDTYFNIVAGVTDILESYSSASIGERFLRIDWLGKNYDPRDFARRGLENFGQSNQHKIALTANTLGFVNYLNTKPIHVAIEPTFIEPILDLAEFIAIIRTKVEEDRFEGIKYRPRAELPTRLSKQLAKLFCACKLVTGTAEHAFRIVRKVAMDTCYGFPLDVVKFILEHPDTTREDIAHGTGIHTQRAYRVLTNLCTTGVLFSRASVGKGKRQHYGINPKILPALNPDRYLIERKGESIEYDTVMHDDPVQTQNRPTIRRPGSFVPSNNLQPRRSPPSKRRS